MAKASKKRAPLPSKEGSRYTFSIWKYIVAGVLAVAVSYRVARIFTTPIMLNHDETNFHLADIPGKGVGLIATALIPKGHLVLTEEPLFIAPPYTTSRHPGVLIHSLVSGLNTTHQQAFFDLSSHAHPNFNHKDVHELSLAIFETNAISAGKGAGIFPRTARLNHGCSRAFNVVYHWREREARLVVHAIRDIHPGEELLTTYTDTKRPRAERQAFLLEVYNFNCSCQTCSLPPKYSAASDRRLALMSDLKSKFASWGQGQIDGAEAVKIAKNLWQVGEEEGYYSERGQLAADVVQVAASHSDAQATIAWAQLAHTWYAIELGWDGSEAALMMQVQQDPQSHWAWGSRVRMDVDVNHSWPYT